METEVSLEACGPAGLHIAASKRLSQTRWKARANTGECPLTSTLTLGQAHHSLQTHTHTHARMHTDIREEGEQLALSCCLGWMWEVYWVWCKEERQGRVFRNLEFCLKEKKVRPGRPCTKSARNPVFIMKRSRWLWGLFPRPASSLPVSGLCPECLPLTRLVYISSADPQVILRSQTP